MTKIHQNSLTTAIISIVVFIPALIISTLSASIGFRDGGVSHANKEDIFSSYFPAWMSNFAVLHIISIVLCIIAIVFAAKSFKKPLVWERVLMMLITMGAIIIILYDIVQLIQ
ncbi:MAG: hypothetical protein ABI266_04060 [Ginsengibacter sp.]